MNMTNNTNDTIDDEQALTQLLGLNSGSPVATPEMLKRMAQWLHATLKREITERPVTAGQEWGRIGDIMRKYGVSKSQARLWLLRLRQDGKVRVQNPIYGLQGKGDTFYNLADVETAFTENAKRLSKK